MCGRQRAWVSTSLCSCPTRDRTDGVAEALWTLNGWARVGGSASVSLGRS